MTRSPDDPFAGRPSAGLDASLARLLGKHEPLSRWMGWRLRLLVLAALAACVGPFLLARSLAAAQHIEARWHAVQTGEVELAASPLELLKRHAGDRLQTVTGSASSLAPVEPLVLEASGRWLIDDALRERHLQLQQALADALAESPVTLGFSDRSIVEIPLLRRGLGGLPPMFWLLAGLALALYLVAMVVLLSRPGERSLLYAVMSLCQSANLMFLAVDATLEPVLPLALPPAPWLALGAWQTPLRMGLDLTAGAALLHAGCIHPRRLAGGRALAMAGWGATLALVIALFSGLLAHAWWWTQAGVSVLMLAATGLAAMSYRGETRPLALVLTRLGLLIVGTWVLLTLTLAGAERTGGTQQALASTGTTAWYVFAAAVLLRLPFLSRQQPVMREFALLAAVSTVGTLLDLLFVSVFSVGQFTSLALALFCALAVYLGARQWILNQLLGTNLLTLERLFEQIYQTARQVETQPERMPALVAELLRDLFEVLEAVVVPLDAVVARASGDGSVLLVPLPDAHGAAHGDGGAPPQAVALRFAQRGRRLFGAEDARLAERVVEQLRRVLAFNRAVEQGRGEERLRLAQDLHDDIGARLLTLMYQAPTPEVEQYLRHTLQDLKTLTRGLAVPTHRLSDAAAEWKADLTHRLTVAGVALDWRFATDRDPTLTVVQWSALTRVLRELVSNAIAHARARHVAVDVRLDEHGLELSVADDGVGSDPAAWSHGLGLGGVRKRVKQLGGEVEWRERMPHGICCRVAVRRF